MPRSLDDIRTDIDALDECIVRSFFDGFSPDRNPGKTIINSEEIAEIRFLQLGFSQMTWQLINARMKLSVEVGEGKKASGKKVVVDRARYEKVIEQAQSHAPKNAREEVRKLYELIHDISVRIQNEIIAQT